MSTFRPGRQQMTEAIMLFRGDGIVTEMLYPEFEAVLDNVVSMPEWADQQARAAYVVINPRLQIRSVVLFYLDFDETGTADAGWNVPLRQLVEKAEYGPDLGGGPVRLVCHSQSPIPWLNMHLWDPDLAPGHNHLHMIRDAVQRNQLRLLADTGEAPASPATLELDKLQVVAEEAWQLPAEIERKEEQERQAAEREAAQRKKAAQLIKQQRLRIRTLEAEHDRALASLRQQAARQQAASQEKIRQLERDLQASLEQNRVLQEQISQLGSIGEDARRELESLAVKEQNQVVLLKAQFEQELQSHKKLLAASQRQQQLLQQQHDARLAELQDELHQVRAQHEAASREFKAAIQAARGILQRLDDAGVSLVTMQPGAGHITIQVDEVDEFLKSPAAYAARYCMVSAEEYNTWLRHYENPVCEAHITVTGEKCGLPLERKTHPGRFTPGISNRCSRHKELL